MAVPAAVAAMPAAVAGPRPLQPRARSGTRPRSAPQPADANFAARLVAWQATHGRNDLPWQNTRDAYLIWLSEVMLQQTQVATVIPYFQRFIARFPDVVALAVAPLDDVLALWAGLGYYRRAHHLHAAAQAVVREHGGVFPVDAATLGSLPGVGRSTAAAVAAFASGERGAILDGNVKRVLARHAGIAGFPGDAAVAARLWSHAEALLPASGIERYTQALMDLGATLCTRSRPKCLLCPVMDDCVARLEERIDSLPSPKPRKAIPHRELQLLVVERSGTILFERRPPTGIWSGLWSLPEFAMGVAVGDALQARFGAALAHAEALPPIEHGFTHYSLTLHPQRVRVERWPSRAEAPGYVWLTPADALNAALPAPIKRLVRTLGS
jgi:A/G-specific adenine glycosylase